MPLPQSLDRPRILVIDDEAAMRAVLEMRLERWSFEVSLAANGEEARQVLRRDSPDFVLLDLALPDVSGLSLLHWIRQQAPEVTIILMTAYGSIDSAVDAMKSGAVDFLTKPLDYGRLRELLAIPDLSAPPSAAEGFPGLGQLVGKSRPMRRLYGLLELLAGHDASAIILGETGTGKEVVARTLHDLSARSGGPFVAVNAAAIPDSLLESELFGHEKGAFTGAETSRKGCFEQASGGTLLLDELLEMPLPLQPKLLRVLEERRLRRLGGGEEIPFDARILAATNQDPVRAVEEGRLREDLFFRLNVFRVELEPLRKRREDVLLLARYFIQRLNARHGTRVQGLTQAAGERLEAYGWPGNVRELRNTMERAVILAGGGDIGESHLPPPLLGAEGELRTQGVTLPARVTHAEAERILIQETLKRVANNKARAARELGLDVKTIRNKLRQYRDSE